MPSTCRRGKWLYGTVHRRDYVQERTVFGYLLHSTPRKRKIKPSRNAGTCKKQHARRRESLSAFSALIPEKKIFLLWYECRKHSKILIKGKRTMMTIEEMKDYIADELKEEYQKLLRNEPNHYSYLFMIANDMGLV